MKTIDDTKQVIRSAWPQIMSECLLVLGSELHYQAMIYHALRDTGGVPLRQIGMNVKMFIENPVSELFKELDISKHIDFRGGFEPIPDIVLFAPEIESDWRRRNNKNTLKHMLVAIEVKASERDKKRLSPSEIELDIRKLAAHREESIHRNVNMLPVMLIIDSAPLESKRMTPSAISRAKILADALDVSLMYVSSTHHFSNV